MDSLTTQLDDSSGSAWEFLLFSLKVLRLGFALFILRLMWIYRRWILYPWIFASVCQTVIYVNQTGFDSPCVWAGIAGALVLPFLAEKMGFTSGGIARGSVATTIQRNFGIGRWFSMVQSLAATGNIGLIGGLTGAVVGFGTCAFYMANFA